MRSFLFSLVFCAGSFSMACDQQEAQIIAKIYQIVKTPVSCTALVRAEDIRFFAPSIICPLDHSEITSFGVNVGLRNGHECGLEVGEELNGIAVRVQGGEIYLE